MGTDPLTQFLEYHAQWKAAYRHCYFTYIAAKRDSQWRLVQGQLILRTSVYAAPPKRIETAHVAAGMLTFAGGYDEAVQTLRQLLGGRCAIDGFDMAFSLEGAGPRVQLLHPAGLAEGRHLTSFTAYGQNRSAVFDRLQADTELKAASPPFDGLTDVVTDVGLALSGGDLCTLEAVALNCAEVDVTSAVHESTAHLGVLLPADLREELVTVGAKVFSERKCVSREGWKGSELTWTTSGPVKKGSKTLEVPRGSAVQSFVSYAGVFQQQWWFTDPTVAQNARLPTVGAFDPELRCLKEFLLDLDQARRNPNFEAGVTILLHLLGFSAVHLGGIRRLSDAPDVLVATPTRHTAVVECTTGFPDEKYTMLLGRAQAIRARLDQAGLSSLRILPVVVTCKPRAEIQSALQEAARLRIAVVCREDLQSALDRVAFVADPESMYNQLLDSLEGGQQQLT
jgi:hypothetical protein